MTAHLAIIYDPKNIEPSNRLLFFDKTERDIISSTTRNRECGDPQTFPTPFDVNLFFGLFFDGTNNNYKRDEKDHMHSNVARLYTAYPDRKNAGTPPYFFPTYIPGVGTEFKEVGDTGEGSMRTKGLAFAYKGEDRIVRPILMGGISQ